ncbi:MAG: ATP-binding protein [Desulfobacteraceae bacterium]
MKTNNSTIMIDENKSNEQLMQALTKIQSQLAIEKRHCQELAQEIVQIKLRKLKKIENDYRRFFDALDVGVGLAEILFDNFEKPYDLRLLSINQVAGRIMKIDPQAVPGKTVSSLFPNADSTWKDILIEVASSQGSVQLEKEIYSLKKIFSIYFFCLEKDIFGCLFKDITTQKYKKQSKEAPIHSSQFPEENPNPVLRCRPDGTILYTNIPAKRWLKTLGWHTGGPLPKVVGIAVAEAFKQKCAAETDIINPAGRTFSIFAAPQPKENYVNLYGTDVTKRKQLEAERLELERRMQQIAKAESLSLMAGAVAHHFNNRLAAVIGNLELAQEDLLSETEISGYLKEANKAAHRAATMSATMLAFLGQSQGIPETLDLSQVCNKELGQLQAEIPDEITLKSDFPQPGPTIRSDYVQLSQVITNLVTNAWEAINTPPGFIRITVESVDVKNIKEENRFPMEWESSTDTYACLTVADTGHGITANNISRIFDPFFTDKFTGRGLGLSVTLGIVKSYEGCITVTSKQGQGSTFRVYWPLSSELLSHIKTDPAVDKKVAPDTNMVLLVEDQKKVRNVGKAMLERLGFEVWTAGDGVEAVEIFRTHGSRFCLVLTDLTMPRMDGWQTLTALRRINPNIPVILTSGYYEAQVMHGDHIQQPQAFLHKPYHMKTLKAVIRQALGNRVTFLNDNK